MGLYALGRIYIRTKSYELAKQCFLKALAIEPDMTSVLLDLGLTYEIQNEPQKAAEVYQKILSLDPDNKRARDRLGRIFLKEKKFDEALDQFQRMQKSDSDDLNIRTKMGLIYLEQGKLDQAILEFTFVLAANPKDDRARYYLGAAYVERDTLDQALSEFKKIPPESDLFADSRRNIFLILKKQNKTGEGIKILEESVQAKPNDEDLYLLLAEVYEKEDHSEKALATLKKGLEKNQKSEGIHF